MRLVLGILEGLLIALIAYNFVVALFGWRNPDAAPRGTRRRLLRIVIPAHDEAHVIGALLSDLAGQDYPEDRFEVWVLADRCSDDTARVARERGALVSERDQGPGGKGAALAWHLEQQPLEPYEALVVLDADNRVPEDLAAGLSDELEQGHQAIQAYLDVANPDATAVATASALSYWASNRMVQLARANLGWPADLGGTGMCLTASALEAAGGFGESESEDQELGVRLFLAGIPVVWAHHILVLDEKPTGAAVAMRQRSRWAAGRRQVARRHFGDLIRKPSMASVDLMIRLVQPSRMGAALASALLAAGSALGAPLLFLVRDQVPGRYLAKYPLLVILPLIKVGARLVRRDGWYHTPHGG